MRNWYLIETSCVYQARKSAETVAAANKGYTVIRADENGFRVCTLVLITPHADQEPFVLDENERSRLEAQFTAAKTKRMKQQVGMIDFTPTWRAMVPVMLIAYRDGNAEGRKAAIEELYRMADAADLWNKHCKETGQ